MRRTIITAVAVIAIAPGFLMVSAPASANPCGPLSAHSTARACTLCEVAAAGNVGVCFDDARLAPASVPNEDCAWILKGPNPSPGAYQGCETAHRPTGN
jgi:hypothetical protein